MQQLSADRSIQNKIQPFVRKAGAGAALQLQDNRKKSIIQKQQLDALNNNECTAQKKENNTGLPDNLKTGVENLSGMAMDDVKVHYNSTKPSQLNAHAYAQGAEIHVAPGQEKHLPHEAWHVVQQKQGRVKPTLQMKNGLPVNDDKGLEYEADVMGGKAVQTKMMPDETFGDNTIHVPPGIIQRGAKNGRPEGKKEEKGETLQERIDRILAANPQIFVAPHYDIYTSDNLLILENYLSGDLMVYRAAQQWFWTFPKDGGFLDLVPKGPEDPTTDPAPDFEANNTNWIPFTTDRSYAIKIGISVGGILRRYWNDGNIDAAKPLVIIQSKKVLRTQELAFGLTGEVQLKWRQQATAVETISLDEDLGNYLVAYSGMTFRSMLGPVVADYNASYYRALGAGSALPAKSRNDDIKYDDKDWD